MATLVQEIDTSTQAADPVAFWCDQMAVTAPAHTLLSEDPLSFVASAHGWDLCGIAIMRIQGPAATVTRTRRMVTEADPDVITLVVHVTGDYRIEQAGEAPVYCGPGDIAIFDSARPWKVQIGDVMDVVSFAIPKTLAGPRVLKDGAVMRVQADAGAARLAGPFLCQVADALGSDEVGADDENVADAVLSLIRSLVSVRQAPSDRRQVEVAAIKRYIDEHIAEPTLTGGQIAAAHAISRRQLYTLFARGCWCPRVDS